GKIMNVLVLLALILLLLMVAIGGKKGARSFMSLFFNFTIVLLTVFIMIDPHANPILLTMIACTAVSAITLFYINKVNSTTVTAFISTIITIAFMFMFIYVVTTKATIHGIGDEEIIALSIFSLCIRFAFVPTAAAVTTICTI